MQVLFGVLLFLCYLWCVVADCYTSNPTATRNTLLPPLASTWDVPVSPSTFRIGNPCWFEDKPFSTQDLSCLEKASQAYRTIRQYETDMKVRAAQFFGGPPLVRVAPNLWRLENDHKSCPCIKNTFSTLCGHPGPELHDNPVYAKRAYEYADCVANHIEYMMKYSRNAVVRQIEVRATAAWQGHVNEGVQNNENFLFLTEPVKIEGLTEEQRDDILDIQFSLLMHIGRDSDALALLNRVSTMSVSSVTSKRFIHDTSYLPTATAISELAHMLEHYLKRISGHLDDRIVGQKSSPRIDRLRGMWMEFNGHLNEAHRLYLKALISDQSFVLADVQAGLVRVTLSLNKLFKN